MSATHLKAEDLHLENVLRQIQAEPRASTLVREQSAFDNIASPFSQRLVLFGAGPLGKTVLAGLREVGVAPLAFSDNNQKLWGGEISGVPVVSPAEAMRLYGESACFVVTIYQGSCVRQQLASMGCARVAPFVALLWKYADIFIPQSCVDLPHRLIEHFDSIRSCYGSLADEKSRRELREQLLWRYWLDFSALSPADDARDTYFPVDLIVPSSDEVFVDCGSFHGDAVISFDEHWNGKYKYIFALEPDSISRSILAAYVTKIGVAHRMRIMPFAVGVKDSFVQFAATGTVTSHLISDKNQTPSVECRRLDGIDWPFVPTYIKMDIEGAEPEAILGATDLLQRQNPILAVCTYHRSEHLWQIPNLIRSIAPDYKVFLRRYAEECWEGVCYAIPSHRLSCE